MNKESFAASSAMAECHPAVPSSLTRSSERQAVEPQSPASEVSNKSEHLESSTALAAQLALEVARREEAERALHESKQLLWTKELELRESNEQLRDFVDNATVGLHRVGADGIIRWANRAELELLGYSTAEYVGHAIADFHVDPHVISDMLERLLHGESLHNYEARMRAKDGSIRHVLVSSSAYIKDGEFIHTSCFTRDITARREAEDSQRERARQLQLVTDTLPVLVSYVDTAHRYHFVNAAYERWFGRSKDEMIGRTLEEVLGVDAYERVRPHIMQALAGTTVDFEAELPYLHGATRYVHATYIPHVADNGKVVGYVGLVTDLTERKNLERFKADAAARAEQLLKVTAAIADAVTRPQVFEALVDRVAEAVNASSAALWLVAPGDDSARLVRSTGYTEATQQRFERFSLATEPTFPALDSLRRSEPVWVTSQAELIQQYPHLAGAITPGRDYRIACLPLVARGQVLGTLGLTMEGSAATGTGAQDERDFLLLVARYASQALERLRLLEAERESRASADAAAVRLGVLSHTSQLFGEAALDLDARVKQVVSAIGAALDSCAGVALLEADGCLHTSSVYHPNPKAQALLEALAAKTPVPLGEGLTGAVAATGKGLLIPTIEPEQLASRGVPAYRSFLAEYPTYALMCVPLRTRGEIIGVVTAMRVRAGESYGVEDLRLLEELAERAAAAIENSRLFAQNATARARAEVLYRFAQAVVAADKLEQVYDAAQSAISAALAAQRSAILTFDGDEAMHFRAWRNLSAAYRDAVDGHSPWPADASAPEPLLVPDAKNDAAMAPYQALFQREGIGALAFIPLVNRGRLLGKFMVYYDAPHDFTASELETARSIANHLASVIARFTAVAALEDTIRSNELFAGVLAHDLRNPLGAIMMGAQLLQLQCEQSELALDGKPIARILSSGERITRMIDQLLDFTLARTGGGIKVQAREVDLGALCTQAVAELQLAHPEWKINCSLAGDQHGLWDPDRLLQVISNLVANAGQHGHAEFGIRLFLDGTASETVHFEIHNQGTIPESLLTTLFDPFRSGANKREQSRGVGLGLFIVREIVRAHGGTVNVASTPAMGTKFTVSLPRHGRTSGARITRPSDPDCE